MAFKVGCIVMAPDTDPNKDRAQTKTLKFELTTVLVELMSLVGERCHRRDGEQKSCRGNFAGGERALLPRTTANIDRIYNNY